MMRPDRPDISGSRVLIVDDSTENIDILRNILVDEGYDLFFATSGNKAIEIASRVKPDLILLDMMMPDMSGIECCLYLKKQANLNKTGIIFVTAKTDIDDLVKGFEVGASDYLTKPVRREEVVVRVKTHLAMVAYQKALTEANLKLTALATKDGLTGIYNRRHFEEKLDIEWRRMKREVSPLSVLLIDVDYFKLYNDTYGHLKGDECLIKIAKCISNTISRPGDIAARFGGEEFIVILPNSNKAGALTVAGWVHAAVKKLAIKHESSNVSDIVTISLGSVTVIPDNSQKVIDMLNNADTALYEAKASGRNCTKAFDSFKSSD